MDKLIVYFNQFPMIDLYFQNHLEHCLVSSISAFFKGKMDFRKKKGLADWFIALQLKKSKYKNSDL